MELFKASQQWSTRPEDQTFLTVQAAYQASMRYAAQADEKPNILLSTIRTEAQEGEVKLVGKGNIQARLSNWAFGQVSRVASAPANYLRSLPATLAAQNLNHGLKKQNEQRPDQTVNIMAHVNGDLLVRAMTSDIYTRIWNWEILERMLPLEAEGWSCPTPFRTKVDEPANPDPTVYVSDHDMFAFLVYENQRVAEPGNPDGLARGFFVENSEVGSKKLAVTTFLYRYMCCNHIVWGAKDVTEIAIRHVGKARNRLDTMFVGLTKYLDESASDLEAKIKIAKSTLIDADKNKVLDGIFNRLRGQITRDALEASLVIAEQNRDTDGDHRSFWGLSQGVTRYSQTKPYADERLQLDKAAAKILDLAF